MAIATTAMGCLPTYEQVGSLAIVLLVLVRMLQGMSVGGQLMSSLVFTLEGHPRRNWGFYGSMVMAGANVGTFLGGIVAYFLRHSLTDDQLLRWGWRLPFLSGILVSLSGFYLKYYCKEDEIHGHGGGGHVSIPTEEQHQAENPQDDLPSDEVESEEQEAPFNPIKLAFARGNRRNLLASGMVRSNWLSSSCFCKSNNSPSKFPSNFPSFIARKYLFLRIFVSPCTFRSVGTPIMERRILFEFCLDGYLYD